MLNSDSVVLKSKQIIHEEGEPEKKGKLKKRWRKKFFFQYSFIL